MTWNRVWVRNFQSLEKVDLDLGRLTVIVGSSSSGKSALLRALRTLATNPRGTSFVTHGRKVATVEVEAGGLAVILERPRSGGGKYCLEDVEERGSGETFTGETFTKIGNQGPPELVAEALGVAADGSDAELLFTDQFDRPYLLAESGATVARVLGSLTNVATLFEAVREGNRQALGVKARLRERQVDREALLARVREFADLPQARRVCEHAEQALLRVQQVEVRRVRLRHLVDRWEIAHTVAEQKAVLPTPPVTTRLDELTASRAALRALLAKLAQLRSVEAAAAQQVTEGLGLEEEAARDLHAALEAAGTCPLCGQTTRPGQS